MAKNYMINVSIILVNYHTNDLLQNCIQSLIKYIKNRTYEIIVVENSSNNSFNKCISEFSQPIIYINNNRNLGFAKANNEGLKKTKGKYILFLNSDTIVLPQTIDKCITFFEANTNIGFLGCKLLNRDGSLQLSYHYTSSLKKILMQNSFFILLNRLLKVKTIADKNNEIFERHKLEHEAPWLCGAFLLTQKSIIIKNDLYFDEDFFLYSEDVELCYRARKKGLKIMYFPEAAIYHLAGGSQNNTQARKNQILISDWLMIFKCYGKIYYIIYILLLFFNVFTDDFFFFKNKVLKRKFKEDTTIRKERKNLINLLKRKSWYIIKNYKEKVFSGESFLKYDI